MLRAVLLQALARTSAVRLPSMVRQLTHSSIWGSFIGIRGFSLVRCKITASYAWLRTVSAHFSALWWKSLIAAFITVCRTVSTCWLQCMSMASYVSAVTILLATLRQPAHWCQFPLGVGGVVVNMLSACTVVVKMQIGRA